MKMNKKLGKISNIKFGYGGYQDVMLGLKISFEMQGSGVCDFKGFWDYNLIDHSPSCQWSEAERDAFFVDLVKQISNLLNDAKVSSLDKLKNKPVELTFEGNTLRDWRILTEVI